jgi:hypothetical protein
MSFRRITKESVKARESKREKEAAAVLMWTVEVVRYLCFAGV